MNPSRLPTRFTARHSPDEPQGYIRQIESGNGELRHRGGSLSALNSFDRITAPSEHLPHVFERFYTARENKSESSGLGLYICKLTVEELGDTIAVESKQAYWICSFL